MCTLSSRHRWASFPKTLLDYDFLRWLGSALDITVRIGVASLPQHWSLLTRIHFGQRMLFSYFHFFIFRLVSIRAENIFDTKRLPAQIGSRSAPHCNCIERPQLLNSHRLQDDPRGPKLIHIWSRCSKMTLGDLMHIIPNVSILHWQAEDKAHLVWFSWQHKRNLHLHPTLQNKIISTIRQNIAQSYEKHFLTWQIEGLSFVLYLYFPLFLAWL